VDGIWDTIGPLTDAVFAEGRATWSEELELMMERHGYREETFFTFSYSPILEDDGTSAVSSVPARRARAGYSPSAA
jgi:hypothetical protein